MLRLEKRPVRLGEVIRQVAERMSLRAQDKHIALAAEARDGLPEIKADPERLTQIVTRISLEPVSGQILGKYSSGKAADPARFPPKPRDAELGILARPSSPGEICESPIWSITRCATRRRAGGSPYRPTWCRAVLNWQ